MNILITCEESQRVCIEFRKLGHNAFSCDIEPCSGGQKERAKARIKTFPGIEKAMAEQWGGVK